MEKVIDIDSVVSKVDKIFKEVDKKKLKLKNPPKEENKDVEKLSLLLRGRKKETKNVYQSEINHFLRFISYKENPDEWDLRKFFENLENSGYSRSYQQNCWYALKKYFKAKEIPWNLDQDEYPKLERANIKKITLSKEQISKMIEIVKLYGSEKEKVLLALSTTYGLRRSEFCSLTESDINRESNILHIQAKKHGEERYHLIPREIRSYIYPWNFDKYISLSSASLIFNSIIIKANIKKLEGMGIHSIRRALVSELASSDLPPMRIYDFLRWKNRNLGMLTEYDNPDYKKVDKLIFSKHPFLELWR